MTAMSGESGFKGRPAGADRALPLSVDRLTAIWSRVLDVAPVLPDSNFFDLGGDSFLAMTMLLEIERETGVTVPFTAIYDAPTVELLAAFLGKQAPKFSPLVCLKSGGAAPPLFIVHGIGGTVMELTKLGSLIDYAGAVYAIQAKGVDGLDVPLSKVEDMADYYVAAIREVQSEGPYFLAGYSFGGLVAVEMSRRLKDMGQQIGLLVLIDAYAHPRTWPLRTRLAVRWRRLRHRMSLVARHPLRETQTYVQLALAQFKRRLRRQGEKRSSVTSWLGDHTRALTPALRLVHAAGEMAVDAYVPRPYPGKLTFLRAERSDPRFPSNPEPVWKPLTEATAIHTVKGDHFSAVGEHIASIAARLSLCLKEGIAEWASPDAPRSRHAASRSVEGALC
jgi:acetoacetyl-CoA synthetase